MSTHRTGHIDRDTAERMLRGARVARRAGGPASGDPLTDLLALAAAPARRHELAGEQAALAAFRAARLVPAVRPRRPSMIKTTLAKLLTLKAAAVLAATAAGGVALAASTGTLPNPLSDTTSKPATTGHVGHPGASASHRGSDDGGPGDANGSPSPSLVGLCHAFLAGAGSEHGKALENPAFTVLITKAGGKDKVEAYCTALLASPGNGATTHPTESAGEHPTSGPTAKPTHPNGAPTSHPGH